MAQFRVRHIKGDTVIIEAKTEEDARRLAMIKRWGPETCLYLPRYRGAGLDVTQISSDPEPEDASNVIS